MTVVVSTTTHCAKLIPPSIIATSRFPGPIIRRGRMPSVDHAQVPSDAGECINRALEVFALVRGRDLQPDARLALGYHRVEEADHVDAFLEKGVGHLLRQRRVVEHDRYDGVLARLDVEARIGHRLA